MRLAIASLPLLAMTCSHPATQAFPETAELGTHRATSARDAPAPPRSDRAKIRFHMARHFDDLRAIEREIRAGDLEEATALAFLLSRPVHDPRMAWPAESAAVGAAALALAGAKSVEEACRLEPRVAAACAACHRAAGVVPVVQPHSAPPLDASTPAAQMARHRWATERLWEGLVGDAGDAWRSGLAVLAATPAPSLHRPAAQRLQRLARDALALGNEADRAATYGEILIACVHCHRRGVAPE